MPGAEFTGENAAPGPPEAHAARYLRQNARHARRRSTKHYLLPRNAGAFSVVIEELCRPA